MVLDHIDFSNYTVENGASDSNQSITLTARPPYQHATHTGLRSSERMCEGFASCDLLLKVWFLILGLRSNDGVSDNYVQVIDGLSRHDEL